MNELAVTIGIILFPGVISTIIVDKIVVHAKPWNTFKFSVYSFVLGVLCYLFLQAVVWSFAFAIFRIDCLSFLRNNAFFINEKLDVWDFVTRNSLKINLLEIFWALLSSAPVALLVSLVLYKKWINKVASFFNVSSKYGDENLFYYFLNSNNIDWVYVRDFERSLTYEGRLVSFSESSKMQEIVLSEVVVYGYEDSEEYYSIPFIYLCRPQGILIIEAVSPELLEEKKDEEKTIE